VIFYSAERLQAMQCQSFVIASKVHTYLIWWLF